MNGCNLFHTIFSNILLMTGIRDTPRYKPTLFLGFLLPLCNGITTHFFNKLGMYVFTTIALYSCHRYLYEQNRPYLRLSYVNESQTGALLLGILLHANITPDTVNGSDRTPVGSWCGGDVCSISVTLLLISV